MNLIYHGISHRISSLNEAVELITLGTDSIGILCSEELNCFYYGQYTIIKLIDSNGVSMEIFDLLYLLGIKQEIEIDFDSWQSVVLNVIEYYETTKNKKGFVAAKILLEKTRRLRSKIICNLKY